MREFFVGFWWFIKEIFIGKQFKRSEVEVVVLTYLKAHGEATTYTLSKLFPSHCYDINTLKRVHYKSLAIGTLYFYLDDMEQDGLIVTEEKSTAVVDGIVQQLDRKQFVRKLPSVSETANA